MVYSITYRRPARVQSSTFSLSSEKSADAVSPSSTSSCPYGIPEALSFDRIIAGGTCPPCTLREFLNFLIYIENAPENLQFFLWFRDYVQRFEQLPEREKALSPPWVFEKTKRPVAHAGSAIGNNPSAVDPERMEARQAMSEAMQGTDFDPKMKNTSANGPIDPFTTPAASLTSDQGSIVPSTVGWSDDSPSLHTNGNSVNHAEKSSQAFLNAKTFQPFTVQPFREEISRIIATYLSPDGNRCLNLSEMESEQLLKALSVTTHPSAFSQVVRTVQHSLRHQAHPNFIRWTICNGNPPRVAFARFLGVTGIVAGVTCAVLFTLSSASRGWRALSAVGFFIGIATLIAAWKGMCVVLHGLHHRHLRPWELFASEEALDQEAKEISMASLTSTCSYENEPWVVKYEKRSLVRKVFDRQVWIQEPALRQIQDTIFLQAIAAGLILTLVAMAIFIPLPAGDYF